MRHYMNLDSAPFRAIESGEKTIELRLNDEKRRALKVGDEIEFSCAGVGYTLIATVKELHRFNDFKELFAALSLDKCGYNGREKEADPDDMLKYYTEENIKKYGALGIELENVKVCL